MENLLAFYVWLASVLKARVLEPHHIHQMPRKQQELDCSWVTGTHGPTVAAVHLPRRPSLWALGSFVSAARPGPGILSQCT